MSERTDAQRWADAESIVDGEPTEFAVQELRRRRRLMWTILWSSLGLLVLLVGASVVLIVVVGHHGHHATPHPKAPLWREITGLVFSGAAIVVLLVGLVRYFRSGAWRAAWGSPALVLTWAQRRELAKQIRGRAPLKPDRVRVARSVTELAVDPRLRRFIALMLAGVVLQWIGQLINAPSIGRVIYTGAFLALYAVLVPFWISRQRQMRAFLEQTRPGA